MLQLLRPYLSPRTGCEPAEGRHSHLICHYIPAFTSAQPGAGASQVALVVKNPAADAGDKGDTSSIAASGRTPADCDGNPLQYSCLENSMDRGAWRATVHGAAESQT